MTRKKSRSTLPGSLLGIGCALVAFSVPASATRTLPRAPLPACAQLAPSERALLDELVAGEEGVSVSEGALLASEAGFAEEQGNGSIVRDTSSFSFAASGPSAGALQTFETPRDAALRQFAESRTSAFGIRSDFAASAAQVLDSTVRGWAESRLEHLIRHRYFSPVLGRFLQTDPMGYADSMSLYQGFGNNPMNMNDPMGLGVRPGVSPQFVQNEYQRLVLQGVKPDSALDSLVRRGFIDNERTYKMALVVSVHAKGTAAGAGAYLFEASPLGAVKNVASAAAGRDLLWGQELSWWQRGLYALPMATLAAKPVKMLFSKAAGAIKRIAPEFDNLSTPLSSKDAAGIIDDVTPEIAVPQRGAVKIRIDKSRYPEAAQHAEDAMASGRPARGRIDRGGAEGRRGDSLRCVECKTGLDRDEFPPAVLDTGGKGASVRHISPSDNRGAGASMGRQIRKLPDGAEVEIVVK